MSRKRKGADGLKFGDFPTGYHKEKNADQNATFHGDYTNEAARGKAAEFEYRARRWIANNPQVWEGWKASVASDVAHCRRWSIAQLTEQTRRYDLVDSTGEPFKISNDLRSALARILCEEVEGAREFVTLRPSVFEAANG